MTSSPEWQGPVGEVWAAEWRRTDRSFAALAPRLDAAILAAAPTGAGRAVDLGCGAGQTSIALAAARSELFVKGYDISPELVGIATERAADRPNLSFAVADVAHHGDEVAAGAVLLFSRHGVMFFDRPADVFARLHAAVAPGARLVFSCFRSPSLNPWASALLGAVTGAAPAAPTGYAPGPFGFADAEWTAAMLAAAGWRAIEATPIDYSYVAGEGDDPVTDAATFFRRIGPASAAIRAASDADRAAMLERLAAALATYRDGDRITFPAAAWIWTAAA